MCAAAETSRQGGFSLVEVLCALAIAASAIVVLSAGTAGSLRGSRSLEMHQGARIILNSILQDELAAADTAPATRQGDSGPYRWRLEIAPSGAAWGEALPPAFRLYRLTASVGWGQGGSVSASALKLAR